MKTNNTIRKYTRCPLPAAYSRRFAFTMIELLIVIAIIILLAGIGIGVGFKLTSAADVEQTKARLTITMNAIKDYYDQTGAYPQQYKADDYRICVRRLDTNGDVLPSYERFTSKLKDLDEKAFGNPPIDEDPPYAIFNLVDAFGNRIRYVRSGGIGGTPLLSSPGSDGKSYYDEGEEDDKKARGKDDIRSDK
ncbi:MAG: hypothetical protein JXA11_04230 [Phycisphaerae bacterium]|nr:hypothetical protein [Phycisphaerae bacterium]